MRNEKDREIETLHNHMEILEYEVSRLRNEKYDLERELDRTWALVDELKAQIAYYEEMV